MEQNRKPHGIIQEWYKSFIENLKKLAEDMRSGGVKPGNDVFTLIGTTPESKSLIAELVSEIDEEYALRRELEKEKDPEAWFKKKVANTLDELVKDGVIEGNPSPDDYEKVYNAILDATDERIAIEAEQTAKELDCETDTLEASEEEEFKAMDDEEVIVKGGE